MLTKMFDKFFGTMNRAFDDFGKDMESAFVDDEPLKDGETEKEVTEREVRPDGTVITRRVVTRRSVTTKKKTVRPETQAEREARCVGMSVAGMHRGSPCQYCQHVSDRKVKPVPTKP